MKVTDKNISLDNHLRSKLDLICERTKNNLDAVVIVDGDEGIGKSNLAAGCAYYCAWKLGRKFTVDNVFFKVEEMLDFAVSTENQVLDWDEAALGGLASNWQDKFQQKLLQMLMVARKKKHIYFICIPKFFKLNEYLVVDRSIALLHVYSPDEMKRGTFVYYRKRNKEKLFHDWRRKHKRNYKAYYDFNGRFGEYLPKVIDAETYEAKKDEAILSLSTNFDKQSPELKELIQLKYKVSQLKITTRKELASRLGLATKTLERWEDYLEKYPDLLGKQAKDA